MMTEQPQYIALTYWQHTDTSIPARYHTLGEWEDYLRHDSNDYAYIDWSILMNIDGEHIASYHRGMKI